MCCSWRILKIKLTRLSSNDPQFRVTLQVFGLQWLSNPRKKEPHQLTEGVPSDYVCVCERVPQNREEIRGSRKSLYIPFSFVRVCCWLCKLNPSKFFLLFFFCPATFSPLVFFVLFNFAPLFRWCPSTCTAHTFLWKNFFLDFFLVPFFFSFLFNLWFYNPGKYFGSKKKKKTRKIIKEKLRSCGH